MVATPGQGAADVPVPATQWRALFVLERGPVNVSSLATQLGAPVSSDGKGRSIPMPA
jgi:hypothetical protein